MTIKLQRCRSHEVNSNPQSWEDVRQFDSDSALLNSGVLDGLLPPKNASGDQYRIMVNGEAFGVLEYLSTCV